MRLTIADCPGLLPKASENVGLGHAFLRHIERSRMLVLVVDLMAGLPISTSSSSHQPKVIEDDNPQRCCEDVETLFNELESYQTGLSSRVGILIANKADLSSDTLNQNLKLIAQWIQRNNARNLSESLAEDLTKHNSSNDCWVSYQGKVYNISSFLPDHPGGDGLLLQYAGKDIEEAMENPDEHIHSSSAYEMLREFQIGILGTPETILNPNLIIDEDFKPTTTDISKDHLRINS
ncbi:hypothetical protein H4Q26_012142 [Puccinia striiformis f. sp. tritici PST-130]|nr:hypothetical protein H4Q26_012142 [Puccinia striiformis f. sp. tritici PST-130]